jgi:radical SAM superfamily enzyme YgiQ (UPF0313 family)
MPLNQRLFPWGLATMARCLEDDGHEIKVLDIFAKDMIRSEVEHFLNQERFDAAAITGFSSITYQYVNWLAETIKARCSSPVVIGGLLADHHYDLLLKKPFIDICALGEGELTAVDLFRHLDDPEKVKGVAFRRNGQIAVTDKRELIVDLDSLPLPNFELWEMARYTRVKMYAHDPSTSFDFYKYDSAPDPESLRPNMTFMSGRGCPYQCTFCSRSYDNLRLKSIERIIDEIKYLKEKYKLRAVHFADELLLANKKRSLAFCREIGKLDLYWDGQARVNTIDKECLIAMKGSNCLSVGLGIESGSDTILKAMRKGITRKQSLRLLTDAKEVGIHLKIQLMGGFPGETKATLAETASLLKEAGLPPRRLNWCTPMPGSELYRQARSDGLIPDEESYIIKLHKGYNNPENIVLNVSGQSDPQMIRLFQWVQMKMDWDYLCTLLQRRELTDGTFRHLLNTFDEVGRYYVPVLANNGLLRKTLRKFLELLNWIAGGHSSPQKPEGQKR